MRNRFLVLLELLSRRVPPGARYWRERVEGITGVHLAGGMLPTSFQTLPEFDHDGFLAEITSASRWLGKAPLMLTPGEREVLTRSGITWSIDGWPLDQLGRAAMLAVASSRLSPSEIDHLLGDVYRRGETRERQALLRALPFLVLPQRFISLAVDGSSSHDRLVFEAIACENPYPADHFQDVHFNQLVLTALSLEIALDRILGIARRTTPALAQAVAGCAGEMRASGRAVPEEIVRLFGTS
ncbi:EboA domain-containing protein [Chondromyces apiculatus]|uniref:Uncharacterized protein n=1 Tax=Chondromyces apiculatus DSM 436 TaxID=1192034 RepID=A0A017T3E9_9BACT|nr:EboA domain-containing protein [Chondromyces apiculatus]EYF03046.1 Hypothetical protein CAP_6309 [Chondromyces apiculatus DSM 436]